MDSYKNIYMVGIGGVGMTALACLLTDMGFSITGVDSENFHTTDIALDKKGITYTRGFEKAVLPDSTDLVITTGAHGGKSNPVVLEAESRSIKILSHAEALGVVMAEFKTKIAVAGTHGKTTTSALGAHVLKTLGVPMGYQVGSAFIGKDFSGGCTGMDYFITEADEFRTDPSSNTPRFMHLLPDILICTNIDHDHVDVYPTLQDVQLAFKNMMTKVVENGGVVIYALDNEPTKEVVDELTKSLSKDSFISYGFNPAADVTITNLRTEPGAQDQDVLADFNVTFKNHEDTELSVKVPLFGKHNALNTTAIIAMMEKIGFAHEKYIQYFETFAGTTSRMEHIYSGDVDIFVDYAHHPTEIEASIEGLRQRYPHRTIFALHQTHTFTRTAQFKDEFIDAMHAADVAGFVDIYGSARESDTHTIKAQDLETRSKELGYDNIRYIHENDLASFIEAAKSEKGILLLMGAGDFFILHRDTILTYAQK